MGSIKQLREDIENQIDIVDVAQKLGITVNKDNKSLCIFHVDHHPSLQFFNTKDRDGMQHYHCFTCNAHGNMFELVKKVQARIPPKLKYKGLILL